MMGLIILIYLTSFNAEETTLTCHTNPKEVAGTLGSHKYKKARYATVNVSKKDLSKIIRKFEKIEKLPYDKKRVKT